MLPYALEIPEVTYDRAQLHEMAKTLKPEMTFFRNSKGGIHHHKVLKLMEDHRARFPYINILLDEFCFGDIPVQPALLQFFPHLGINLHVDDERGCVIQFPLTPEAEHYAPIEWHEDGRCVYQHTYKNDRPTLVDTQRPHLVANQNAVRIAFQIGLKATFEHIVDLYQSGSLLRQKTS
jgi:hypothetical protein